jgi:hypothetical protein
MYPEASPHQPKDFRNDFKYLPYPFQPDTKAAACFRKPLAFPVTGRYSLKRYPYWWVWLTVAVGTYK